MGLNKEHNSADRYRDSQSWAESLKTIFHILTLTPPPPPPVTSVPDVGVCEDINQSNTFTENF